MSQIQSVSWRCHYTRLRIDSLAIQNSAIDRSVDHGPNVVHDADAKVSSAFT